MTFRVEEKLKYEFEKIAKKADMTASQILRSFMRETVEKSKKRGNK